MCVHKVTESMLGIFPQTLLPLFLKSCFSRFWFSLVQFDWPASKPSICLSPPPYHRGYKQDCHSWLFHTDSGNQTQVLKTALQMLYWLSHLLGPSTFVFQQWVISDKERCYLTFRVVCRWSFLPRLPINTVLVPQITTQRFVINYKCLANSLDLFVVISYNLN